MLHAPTISYRYGQQLGSRGIGSTNYNNNSLNVRGREAAVGSESLEMRGIENHRNDASANGVSEILQGSTELKIRFPKKIHRRRLHVDAINRNDPNMTVIQNTRTNRFQFFSESQSLPNALVHVLTSTTFQSRLQLLNSQISKLPHSALKTCLPFLFIVRKVVLLMGLGVFIGLIVGGQTVKGMVLIQAGVLCFILAWLIWMQYWIMWVDRVESGKDEGDGESGDARRVRRLVRVLREVCEEWCREDEALDVERGEGGSTDVIKMRVKWEVELGVEVVVEEDKNVYDNDEFETTAGIWNPRGCTMKRRRSPFSLNRVKSWVWQVLETVKSLCGVYEPWVIRVSVFELRPTEFIEEEDTLLPVYEGPRRGSGETTMSATPPAYDTHYDQRQSEQLETTSSSTSLNQQPSLDSLNTISSTALPPTASELIAEGSFEVSALSSGFLIASTDTGHETSCVTDNTFRSSRLPPTYEIAIRDRVV
jgi:hypothetical protein